MYRQIENSTPNQLIKYLETIASGITSMAFDYSSLYTKNELNQFLNILSFIKEIIKQIQNKIIDIESINKIFEYERLLKPYILRCWAYDYNNGKRLVSWFKNDEFDKVPEVISSTFGDCTTTFCNARYGISYELFSENAFLGACNKDAATIIEENVKKSIFTIGNTKDGKVINSYNFATPIITPLQALDQENNDYKSKHNEIILDSRYVKPKSVVYFNPNDLDIVNQICLKYGLESEYIKEKDI